MDRKLVKVQERRVESTPSLGGNGVQSQTCQCLGEEGLVDPFIKRMELNLGPTKSRRGWPSRPLRKGEWSSILDLPKSRRRRLSRPLDKKMELDTRPAKVRERRAESTLV